MTDKQVKAMTADIETPTFETTAFTTPPPLDEATVAIVTSASLHHPDDDDFAPADTGFRVLDAERRDYVLGHWSPNFDTTGFALDLNTVFPIDRLDELAAKGVIGEVADRHLSYAGNQFDLSAIRMDSGPAGARWLREQGVDVVLLTPV
jgi:D-proline reductase (dithiol) PrdB